MNLTLLPLLVVALLMAAAEPGVDSVEVVMSGQHAMATDDGATVVADAVVTIPGGVSVAGPVLVIGGELDVVGTVSGDVVQLAGTVRVRPDATITGQLRHIGGTEVVAPGAGIGSRTSLPVTSMQADPTAGLVTWLVGTLLLAGIGASLARRRGRALDNVAGAATHHPVITVTVGLLLALTLVAVFVLMAFTLVLLPVVAIGVVASIAVLAYGIIALGRAVAARIPIVDDRWATAAGIVVVMAGLQVLGVVPLVGDLVALAILLAGLGAVMVTSFGLRHFRPDVLPD